MSEAIVNDKLLNHIKETLNLKFKPEIEKNSSFGIGLSNMNTILIVPKTKDNEIEKKLFLRIKNKPPIIDYFSMEREFKCLQFLHKNSSKIGLKIAEPLMIDISKKIIPYPYQVNEFLEGKTIFQLNQKWKTQTKEEDQKMLKENKISKNDFIKKCAQTLKKLHSFSAPKVGSKERLLFLEGPEPEKVLKGELFTSFLDKLFDKSFNSDEDLKKIFQKIFTLVKPFKPIMIKSNSSQCYCHYDAHEHNFLIKKDGNLDLIDWEGFGYGHFTNDLATFTANSPDFTEKEEKVFLKEYGFNDDDFENKVMYWINKIRRVTTVLGFLIQKRNEMREQVKKLTPDQKEEDVNKLKGTLQFFEGVTSGYYQNLVKILDNVPKKN